MYEYKKNSIKRFCLKLEELQQFHLMYSTCERIFLKEIITEIHKHGVIKT